GGRDVHRAHETKALLNAALFHQPFNRVGDVDEATTVWDFKPKMFRERFHRMERTLRAISTRSAWWLGDLFIAEVLVHGKPAEVSASALDALFGIELEAVAVEKWPGRKTDVGGDARRSNGTQRGLDAPIETAANSAADKRGMSEEKVEVAVVG